MRAAIGGFALLGVVACAGVPSYKKVPHDEIYQRLPSPRSHPAPRADRYSFWWDALLQSTLRPLAESLSPGHHLEQRLIDDPASLDVNHFGQVVDSPWYTNRICTGRLSSDELLRGGRWFEGPAVGRLTVTGGKFEGATPGMFVEDRTGRRFLVKFDPAAFPGMSSAAELIATRILHAAGYHVPDNYVGELDLNKLVLSPNALRPDEHGRPVQFTRSDLEATLAHVNPYPNNRTRALFSRILPGRNLGPFAFRGVRADDPNDLIPHERRRSLRGLWMFQAWLNNPDTHSFNTLDTFIPSDGDPELGSLRHHLIDFGDALGASGARPKYPGEGYEAIFDWPVIGRAFVSVGLWYRYWLPLNRSPFRSVGIFEAEVFEPERWRSNLPNPAFEAATALDEYWAAATMSCFTPEVMRQIVASAGYTERGAAEWVLRVLTERQYKLMELGFARVLPLDRPRIAHRWVLELTDLEVETNMRTERQSYEWSVEWDRSPDAAVPLGAGESLRPVVDLGPLAQLARQRHGAAFLADPFLTVRWRRAGTDPTLTVRLRVIEDRALLVAVEREVD